MALQDLTTYNKVDPDAKLTVTSTRVTWALGATHTTYLDKDFGASFFSGDFTHQFDFESTDISAGNQTNIWGLADALGDANDIRLNGSQHEIWVDVSKSGANEIVEISEVDGANIYSTTLFTLTLNTIYYATVSRTGTTFTCTVYSDSSRTTQVATKSLTLHSTISYRYLYAMQSYAQNPAGAGFAENFNLNPVTPNNSSMFLVF